MNFKKKISKVGEAQRWLIKEFPQSIVMRRVVDEINMQELVVSWVGESPRSFEVKTSLRHPKFGLTTLRRIDLDMNLVLKIIENPRYHTRTGKGYYIDNVKKDTYHQVLKRMNKGRDIPYKQPKPGGKKIKNTGERAMFLRIWAKRPHRSEISGEPLIEDVNHPMWVNQFMHVLPKGLYPHYRLEEFNIVLGTKDEHFKQTNQIHKCHEDPRWDSFFLKFATLKAQYMEDFPVGKNRYDNQ